MYDYLYKYLTDNDALCKKQVTFRKFIPLKTQFFLKVLLVRKSIYDWYLRNLSSLLIVNFLKHTAWKVPIFGNVLSFPAFGMNTERYGVSLCIQSECGKIRTRRNPNKNTFHTVTLIHFRQMIYFYVP